MLLAKIFCKMAYYSGGKSFIWPYFNYGKYNRANYTLISFSLNSQWLAFFFRQKECDFFYLDVYHMGFVNIKFKEGFVNISQL